MQVAAIQMASGSVIQANLQEAEKQIRAAVTDGAQLVVLPENFGMVGARQEDVVEYREQPGQGPIQDFLAALAKELGITLIGGSVPIATDTTDKYRNSLLVFDATGTNIARYDKIHLFDVTIPGTDTSFCESDVIQAGDQVVVVDADGVRIGLSICYDLRFPELYRKLAEKGAQIIVVPAAFTAETGQAHWHALLKARAIENLSFVIASAQGGYHVNGRETFGHSLIVDPWGKVLDEIASGTGFASAQLNLGHQAQLRERFPVLSHRKLI